MRYIPILFIPFIISCSATKKIVKQEYPTPFQFELVDSIPGTKADIYVKAHEWIAKTFVSAESVIDMSDKEAGKIIGKAIMTTNITKTGQGKVNYVISIDARDGKYRCILSGFAHSATSTISRPYTSVRSYGDLSKEKFMVKSESYNKMIEDKRFYQVKNMVTDHCEAILADLKTKMHDRSDSF